MIVAFHMLFNPCVCAGPHREGGRAQPGSCVQVRRGVPHGQGLQQQPHPAAAAAAAAAAQHGIGLRGGGEMRGVVASDRLRSYLKQDGHVVYCPDAHIDMQAVMWRDGGITVTIADGSCEGHLQGADAAQ